MKTYFLLFSALISGTLGAAIALMIVAMIKYNLPPLAMLIMWCLVGLYANACFTANEGNKQ